jgi:transposase
MMTEKGKRAAYTLEFKLEAVRLVQGGQSESVTAKVLDITEGDAGQLGAPRRQRRAYRGWHQAGECRANGACAAEGGTGAGQDGARYLKKPPSRVAASPMPRNKRCVH